MIFRSILLFIPVVLLSCNHIKSGDSLSQTDIERIQKLNLLEKDETIYQFYSEYRKEVAGNFFTNKRMATYWIDEQDKSKNETSFAFYPDIKTVDTVYYAGATLSPYMLVTKMDGSSFKVCADGKQKNIKSFFEEALSKWKQNKNIEQY